jgi:hypothetical protein
LAVKAAHHKETQPWRGDRLPVASVLQSAKKDFTNYLARLAKPGGYRFRLIASIS